jgi:hypothetical protein
VFIPGFLYSCAYFGLGKRQRRLDHVRLRGGGKADLRRSRLPHSVRALVRLSIQPIKAGKIIREITFLRQVQEQHSPEEPWPSHHERRSVFGHCARRTHRRGHLHLQVSSIWKVVKKQYSLRAFKTVFTTDKRMSVRRAVTSQRLLSGPPTSMRALQIRWRSRWRRPASCPRPAPIGQSWPTALWWSWENSVTPTSGTHVSVARAAPWPAKSCPKRSTRPDRPTNDLLKSVFFHRLIDRRSVSLCIISSYL